MLHTYIHKARQLFMPRETEVTDEIDMERMSTDSKANLLDPDWAVMDSDKRYFVSCYRKMGVFGWLYYTRNNPVALEESTSERDIAYLMDLRREQEPHCFIDTPKNLINRLHNVSTYHFNPVRTTTVEQLRSLEATRFIETFIEDLPHPETVFLIWLRAQLRAGMTELCGIVLQDHVIHINGSSKLSRAPIEKKRTCAPEQFLRYYQRVLIANYESMPRVPDLVCIGGWQPPSLAELARGLLKQQTSGYLGLTEIMLQDDTHKLAVAVRDAHQVERV